ncbi:glutathione S-transferase [Brevundimonas sp. LM2]|uniref:glutathione S-transferase n=1 Tax=Brevundimonas sp. LM2 TaxID=1938605 RepID=UPI000983AD0E|nr:glutathione S-transferase [Brevundimonas sp. LM2]AQR62594.1 glutathione S-transferase [Brevundimonas sp. LM2]
MELIVGNMAFSTWSLRPWLVLKRCGADFTTTEIPLYGPDSARLLAEHSPTGQVPVLKVEGETIWDSMAISVWASERYPDAGLWPADAHARWLARSVTCEMHGSFTALRTQCSMGPDAAGVVHTLVGPDRAPTPTSDAVARDVRRLVEIMRTMRARFGGGGPYLFGAWSMADAFLTPVAARFRHYQFDLADYGDDGTAATYVAELLRQPDFLAWSDEAVTKLP